MSKKAPPQKKRHTKPCRYFQANRCPHPAEVCDFAHILVAPVPPVFVTKVASNACQFFSVGYCGSGPHCSYPHDGDTFARKPFDPSVTSENNLEWPGVVPLGNYDGVYAESPPVYGSFPPYVQHWPPSPFPTTNLNLAKPSVFTLPARSRDSIDTISTSVSSAESDDLIVITDDPKYSEHSHPHQSQVRVADDAPVVHVPPFFQGIAPSVPATQGAPFEVYYPASQTGVSFPARGRPGVARTPSKRKSLKYKTKPCKFYTVERGCPNGETCTFIHDATIGSINKALPQVKRESEEEEEGKKTFFPIPWRVIGGGVLVGTKREEEECPAYPSDVKILPPIKTLTRKRSNSIPSIPSPLSIKVEHLFSAECPGVL